MIVMVSVVMMVVACNIDGDRDHDDNENDVW